MPVKPKAKPRRRITRTKRVVPSSNGGWKALAILLFFAGQLIFLNCPLFKLSQISVSGNGNIPKDEILSLANIVPGENLLTLDLKAVRERLASVGRIRRVEVRWLWPGRISICIQERVPAFLVMSEKFAGQWFCADQEGKILDKLSGSSEASLPRILLDVPVRHGMVISSALLKSVQRWKGLLEEPGHEKIKEMVVAFTSDTNNNLALRCWYRDAPLKITLGRVREKVGGQEMAEMGHRLEKLSPLLELLASKNRRIEGVDLRCSEPIIELTEEGRR
ncbi:MAG: FtsQ-type POTRA domain-containing protein [bacterium]